MITHSEALKIVLNTEFRTGTEKISITDCENRVLAADIFSNIDMPPFDKAMVDGYAILGNDIENVLLIQNTIKAGDNQEFFLTEGNCIKVMTGAPIPKNTEMVIMIEDVEVIENKKIKITNKKSSTNISPKGEDIRTGDKVLSRGLLMKPVHCGILASLGYTEAEVYELPKIGLIVTGNEVIEPFKRLRSGQIYNSNAYILMANCLKFNIILEYYGIVEDTFEATNNAINSMISRNDVLLVTGGVSEGDYDFVAPVLKKSGLEIKFDSVASQPGRPLTYATDGKKFCFGLPGNPISGLITFETIVKPFLYKIMGHDFNPKIFPFTLNKKISRRNAKRKSFYPVKLNDDNTVEPLSYHGSAHLNSYTDAFGIISLDIGVLEIEKGEMVDVRQI